MNDHPTRQSINIEIQRILAASAELDEQKGKPFAKVLSMVGMWLGAGICACLAMGMLFLTDI